MSYRRRRDVAVESLRLFAICGIAIFHTFQPFFNAYAYAQHGVSTAWIGGGSAFLLGLISLLGATGNGIFFMISGFYLLPRLRSQAFQADYWHTQSRVLLRRVLVISASVALYTLIGVILTACHVPVSVPGRSAKRWLVGGLEFIWLYLVFCALAPLIAWCAARISRRSSKVVPLIVAVCCIAVIACNQWIAFADRGEFNRGFFDWRKLMSAATYFTAFLLAGLMGEHKNRIARYALPNLWTVSAIIVTLEVVAAIRASHADVFLLGALSYKSTSALSYALATSLLAVACRSAIRHPAERVNEPEPVPAKVIRLLASSILGFYICQSLLFVPWHDFCITVLGGIVARPLSASPLSPAAPFLFFLAGIGASLLYALVLMGCDLLIRRPIVRSLLRLSSAIN